MKHKTILVDFDGTLVEYNGERDNGHLGKPVPAMVDRVKNWIKDGHTVMIFTSRLNAPGLPAFEVCSRINRWCQEHLGKMLPVTDMKVHNADEFWDDRAIRVTKNTGQLYHGSGCYDVGSVPDIMAQAIGTFQSRNTLYGQNYKTIGELLMTLFKHTGGFPEIKTAEDATRLNLIISCAAKLQRYCSSFTAGGHKDSARDLMVYAAMLEEVTK